MAGEVTGVELRGVSVACGGTRSGADRRDEVEVSPKCRSHGHDVSDLVPPPPPPPPVLETVEESCACGEDRVLVGLR